MVQRLLSSAFVLLLLLPAAARAQDTPTERDAARDVLKKMAALEQSLDVPGLVSRLTMPNAERDKVVARTKELLDKELLGMADDIAYAAVYLASAESGFVTGLNLQVDGGSSIARGLTLG